MPPGEFVFPTLAAGLTLASVAVYVLKWDEEPHRSEDEPLPPDEAAWRRDLASLRLAERHRYC